MDLVIHSEAMNMYQFLQSYMTDYCWTGRLEEGRNGIQLAMKGQNEHKCVCSPYRHMFLLNERGNAKNGSLTQHRGLIMSHQTPSLRRCRLLDVFIIRSSFWLQR